MTKPDGKQAHKIVHFGDYYNLRLVDTNHGKERQLVLDYGVLEKNQHLSNHNGEIYFDNKKIQKISKKS